MELTKNVRQEEVDLSLTKDLEEDKDNKKRVVQEDALGRLASELGREFTDFVGHKEPIEERWLRDITQYHGKYFQDEDLGFNENSLDKVGTRKKSNIFVNITRAKTDSA